MFDQYLVKQFLVIIILFLIIDSLWLGFVAGPKYKKSILEIQGEPMVPDMKMAILVYFAMTFLLNPVKQKNIKEINIAFL